MFVLRQENSDEPQRNMAIGSRYSIIHKDHNPDDFESAMERFTQSMLAPDDDCYAFIETPDKLLPLFTSYNYYIMNQNGGTFANITYKP